MRDAALTAPERLFMSAPDPRGMDRSRFQLTSLASALAVPLAAEAQPAGKVSGRAITGTTRDRLVLVGWGA
jgi:hypothetical protein